VRLETSQQVRVLKISQTIITNNRNNVQSSGRCSCCHCHGKILRLTAVHTDVQLSVNQGSIFSDNSLRKEDQHAKSNIKLPEHFSVFRLARSNISDLISLRAILMLSYLLPLTLPFSW
jgi:hypothetical protein